MKKIAIILIFITFVIFFPIMVKANSIDNIDMDIYIDKNGTAHVTEVWSANLDAGSEGYKPYYNLGKAKITNFKVSENNKTYTFVNHWNTMDNFYNKAYKNGINYISSGLELCWGISSYGYHNYKLTYDIEGFVAALQDADMVYWQLVPYELSSKPGNINIKIYSDEKFQNTLPVWGYGKYGAPTYVKDGYIHMNSKGTLNSNEYMTILIKFDKGTFNTYYNIDHDFKYYLDMANEGAVKYKMENSILYKIILILFSFFKRTYKIIIVIFIVFKIFVHSKINFIKTDKSLKFGVNGKVLPNNIPYIRDIPFNNDIYRTFWIAINYNINNRPTDFLGAILLKWSMENKIRIIKIKNKTTYKKKEETAIDLTLNPIFDDKMEKLLFDMLVEASDGGVLETKEFKKWCKNNYDDIFDWFESLIEIEKLKLIKEEKIKKESYSKFYTVMPSLKEDAIKLKGFKKYLKSFSKMKEKDALEVNMWEYYLIYAQILGIANKVAKGFKKLYPDIIKNDQFNFDYNDFKFIDDLSYSTLKRAASYSVTSSLLSFTIRTLSSSSSSSTSSYSSGGGGHSSGGGGGGSFGGGGGGGGFR